MNSPSDSIELLEQLRATPQLLEAIAASTQNEFKLQAELRLQYPPELVVAALQLHQARVRAAEKFSRGREMWVTRQGVEQSTAEAVARYKAQRFEGVAAVHDLCCGIGGDAIALAAVVPRVEAFDLSPAACWRTARNAELYGVGDRICTFPADVTQLDLTGLHVHLDPDRRSGPQRAIRLEGYEPPLPFLQQLTRTAAGGAIKLSPASNFGGKFSDCELELISLDHECKEAVVWFGDRRQSEPFRATVLPSGESLAGDPFLARGEQGELGEYLYDPDPAVVRAGLVDLLAERTGLWRLDAAEEYLSQNVLLPTQLARPFRVLAEFPYDEATLRAALQQADVGELEIKCRHTAVPVEQLRKRLKLRGTQRRVLLIARIAGKTRAVLAQRMP
jgi:SAM-dependent methyltransferase